jgi:cholesterol transport system auxiliary component
MRVIPIVLPVLLLTFVVGCSGIVPSGEPVDRNYFAFETKRTGAARSPTAGTVLQIRPVTISPRYQGRELVYRMDEAKWESDFYNSFFMPPVNLITEESAGWLKAAGLFESVVGPSSFVRPTHMIEAHVVALYGDFRTKEGPAAVLEITAFLLEDRAGKPAIALQKRYARRVKLTEQTVEALVEGWNRALTEVLTELEADLAAADLSVRAVTEESD